MNHTHILPEGDVTSFKSSEDEWMSFEGVLGAGESTLLFETDLLGKGVKTLDFPLGLAQLPCNVFELRLESSSVRVCNLIKMVSLPP